MKKLSVICLLLVGIILIFGCIDVEKMKSKTSTSSESSNKTSKETSASPSISITSPPDNNSSAIVPGLSQPELMPGEFDINITSYYFVYMRDNLVMYENISTPTFDLVEKNYVIYNLTIKNNDTNTLNFSINKLQLHAKDQVFSPANPGGFPENIPCLSCTWVFSEIIKENRLNDTLLHPDQTLEGIVIFQMNNYTTLFDRSFSLRYNTTPILSRSYDKSLEALTVAEQFDYSNAFHMPPYDIHRGGDYSSHPPETGVSYTWGGNSVLYTDPYTDPGDYYVWANWVNRTVFESYKKYDEMSLSIQKPENIPYVEIAYAVKVMPEQDMTVWQNTSVPYYSSGEKRTRTQLDVIDDTGKELFTKYFNPGDNTGLAILDNQTYMPFSGNMPRMFIPQATIVHFSFYSNYGESMAMRLTFNNQDIILDEQHNITLARYDNTKFVS